MKKGQYSRIVLGILVAFFLVMAFLFLKSIGSSKGETDAKRLSYMENIGFLGEETDSRQIRLPASWEDVGESASFLEEWERFLAPYAGETVTVYSYKYQDPQKFTGEFFADLIVYQERILGCVIFSVDESGNFSIYSEEDFKNLDFSE